MASMRSKLTACMKKHGLADSEITEVLSEVNSQIEDNSENPEIDALNSLIQYAELNRNEVADKIIEAGGAVTPYKPSRQFKEPLPEEKVVEPPPPEPEEPPAKTIKEAVQKETKKKKATTNVKKNAETAVAETAAKTEITKVKAGAKPTAKKVKSEGTSKGYTTVQEKVGGKEYRTYQRTLEDGSRAVIVKVANRNWAVAVHHPEAEDKVTHLGSFNTLKDAQKATEEMTPAKEFYKDKKTTKETAVEKANKMKLTEESKNLLISLNTKEAKDVKPDQLISLGVESLAKKMAHKEDVGNFPGAIESAMDGIYRAAVTYDASKGASFKTWAKTQATAAIKEWKRSGGTMEVQATKRTSEEGSEPMGILETAQENVSPDTTRVVVEGKPAVKPEEAEVETLTPEEYARRKEAEAAKRGVVETPQETPESLRGEGTKREIGRTLSKKKEVRLAPTTEHSTDLTSLEGVLRDGLKVGSAIDISEKKGWTKGEPIRVVFDSADVELGDYVDHNGYYKIANSPTPKEVIVDLDAFTESAVQDVIDRVESLQEKFKDTKFTLKGEKPKVDANTYSKQNVIDFFRQYYELDEKDAKEIAKDFMTDEVTGDLLKFKTMAEFREHMQKLEELGKKNMIQASNGIGMDYGVIREEHALTREEANIIASVRDGLALLERVANGTNRITNNRIKLLAKGLLTRPAIRSLLKQTSVHVSSTGGSFYRYDSTGALSDSELHLASDNGIIHLHEIIHAITARTVFNRPDVARRIKAIMEEVKGRIGEYGVNVKHLEAVDGMSFQDYKDFYRNLIVNEPWTNTNIIYAFRNEREFLAQAISEGNFQDMLAEMKSTRPKQPSFLDKVIDILHNLLGLPTKHNTILRDVITQIDSISEFQNVHYANIDPLSGLYIKPKGQAMSNYDYAPQDVLLFTKEWGQHIKDLDELNLKARVISDIKRILTTVKLKGLRESVKDGSFRSGVNFKLLPITKLKAADKPEIQGLVNRFLDDMETIANFSKGISDVQLAHQMKQWIVREQNMNDLFLERTQQPTLKEFLEMVKLPADSPYTNIMDAITQVFPKELEDLRVWYRTKIDPTLGHLGQYNPELHFLEVNTTNFPGEAIATLIHEAVHAVTVRRLLTDNTFRKQAFEIYNEYIKNIRKYEPMYAHSNILEFFSEALSKKSFQDELAKMKSIRNPDKSVLDMLRKFFTDFLKRFGLTDATLLDDVLDITFNWGQNVSQEEAHKRFEESNRSYQFAIDMSWSTRHALRKVTDNIFKNFKDIFTQDEFNYIQDVEDFRKKRAMEYITLAKNELPEKDEVSAWKREVNHYFLNTRPLVASSILAKIQATPALDARLRVVNAYQDIHGSAVVFHRALEAPKVDEEQPRDWDKIEKNLEKHDVRDKPLKLAAQFGEAVLDFFKSAAQSVSEAVRAVNPIFLRPLYKMEAGIIEKNRDYQNRVKYFINGYRKMDTKDQRLLDLTLLNQHRIEYRKKRDEILKKYSKYDMVNAFAKVEEVLDEIYKRGDAVGIHQYEKMQFYFPRRVKDIDKLLSDLQKSGEYSSLKAEFDRLGKDATQEQKEKAVKHMLNTGVIPAIALLKPTAAQQRIIDTVSSKWSNNYHNAIDSLIAHIYENNEKIGIREFFIDPERQGMIDRVKLLTKRLEKGKNIEQEDRILMVGEIEFLTEKLRDLEGEGYDRAITQMIADEGVKLSDKDFKALLRALRSRLTQKGTHGPVTHFRNVALASVLGNPTSAITQIGDLAFSIFAYGPVNTVKAILGEKLITPKDLDLSHSMKDFQQAGTARWLDNVLRFSGLVAFDQFGKTTTMNAAIRKAQGMSLAEFKKENYAILAKDTEQTWRDLQHNKNTELTRFYAFKELSKWQPVSLSEMPAKYLTAGNGRIFYTLKSYNIKALNSIYREITERWKSADNYAERAAAGLRAGELIMMIVMLGATADELKDFLLGKDAGTFKDSFFDNIFKITMMSRYTLNKGFTEGDPLKTFLQDILVPPTKWATALPMDIVHTLKGEPDYRFLESLPWGRVPYSWTSQAEESRDMSNLKRDITSAFAEGESFSKLRSRINKYNAWARTNQENLITFSVLNKAKKRKIKAEREKK